jgi:signal transduction histidine kinase
MKYAILFFIAFINSILGYVLLKGKSNKYNVYYFLVVLSLTLWVFGVGMFYYFPYVHDNDLFFVKLLYFFGALIPTSFLGFVILFPDNKNTIKEWRKIFLFFPNLILFYLIFMTPFIIRGVYMVDDVKVISYGDLVWVFNFEFIVFMLIAYILLLKKYHYLKNRDHLLRTQFNYIITGTSITSLLGSFFNVILPMIGNFSFFWLGPLSTIFMVSFFTYAIVKYRLMNIRLIITRSILYTILVAAVASLFALSVIVVGNTIGSNTKTSKIITYIITSFIVVIFLDPVKRTWAKITDKIFYKDKIDYQEVLREAGNVVAREINLYKLLEGTTDLLADKLKVKRVSSFVLNSKKEFSLLVSSDKKRQKFSLTHDFVTYLKKSKKILIVDELIRDLGDLNEKTSEYKEIDHFIKEAETRKAEMIIPIIEKDNVTAILLFDAKQSGDLYGQDDINFLEVFSPQIATALEKAKLYEEVEEFNKELQQKVEDRTESLQEANFGLEERNKFLTTIQVVTNMISRTLDLKKVNQMIADSIATELSYVGGMLSFVDKDNKYLQVGAITNNEETRKAFKFLSKEPREYKTKLEENYNLSAQTFLTGKINFSDKMSDFISPPVEKLEIEKIQKSLGIKTIVGVPVFSEAKIIGVIQYYLPIKRDKISSLDIEIMTALTNQVGIVSRNLKLYNTLQGANAELQDANTRLRELDKAKSEFLSIASHQLRTPISAIKGYLSMMIDGDFGPLPKNISDVIKNLFESSARLARLINIFLNVSRIESGRLKLDKKPIQINELIEGVIIELINQAKQKGIKLEYKKKKKAPPLIFADADKLREVVLNLIDNSIKYTPEGSVIVTVEANEDELNFKVTDTGIGIKKEEVKSLFRKFVRGSGVAQVHTGGSGLGLFIAQKIIKEHDGKVWAESEGKGKGSVFQFTVPVYDENQVPAYKEEAEEAKK